MKPLVPISDLRHLCAVLLALALSAASAFAQVTPEQLRKDFGNSHRQHPYLFFTENEKPAILARIESDPESRTIMKRLLAEGNRFVRMPFEPKVVREPEHPRFETDSEASSYISEISQGAMTLSFLYQMTGDVRYATRAAEFALAICDLPQWINPAHRYDIIQSRVWPWNVPDDQVVFSYDITSARFTNLLSIVYDWTYPALTRDQRNKIRGALLDKAITRVRGNDEFFWWSTAYRCNWSVICYSGLGMAALTLANEHPQLLDVAAEAANRINRSFDQIDDAGGWQEGRGYFAYMMDRGTLFIDALKRATNGHVNLFQHPKVKAHAYDFELYSLTADFGDGGGVPMGPTSIVNKLIAETGSTTTAWYRENLLGDGDDMFDIIWPRSNVRAKIPNELSARFPGINWAVLRSDFLDSSTVTIACKAGFNDDPHHGHLDCGQFKLTWHGVSFIRDLGRMRYDEHYFDEERFDYPYASSEGHNVISVNGEWQIPAKKKNQPWREGIGGKILDFRTSGTRDYVLMDPSRAYPGKEVLKWRRSIVLDKPTVALVLDEIHTDVGAEIKSRFFPGVGLPPSDEQHGSSSRRSESAKGEILVKDDLVLLSDGNDNSMALIPLALENRSTLQRDKLASMSVVEDAQLTWIPYIETVTKASSSMTVIATLILPVPDEHGARQIAKSSVLKSRNANEIEVRARSGEREFVWVFSRGRDGYVLKME